MSDTRKHEWQKAATVNTGRKKQVEHLARKVESAVVMLRKFDEATIAELLRRGEYSPEPDGMPGGGSSNGSKSADETTTTESAALRGLSNDPNDSAVWLLNDAGQRVRIESWGKHQSADPIGDFIQEIIERLSETYDIARILDKRRQVVLHAADSKRGREQVTSPCRICEELPAVKNGMDINCYNDWWKHGSPDRLRWEMWKHQTTKKDVDTDGTVLMVPECPPPTPGCKAIRGPWREGGSVDTSDTPVMQGA